MPDHPLPLDSKPPFQRVLIANRGEIAHRILQAARELGIETVGVYSDADRRLPHLAECDHTVNIGPAPSAQSYLNIERLVQAATDAGCDCVHPGYGFLAENATAARAFEAAGVKWVGPTGDAIEKMGDKIVAKELMAGRNVPTVPGFVANADEPDRMRELAEQTGFPLLIKPAGGGGGKGMTVVRSADELVANLKSVAEQAMKSFGAAGLLVERFLERPRHIEVQVLADHHGNVVHLNERECSIQRRQQKLIEETPSTALNPGQRAAICNAGVEAARAANYTNAGTVEFLFDDQTGDFFFLEMNTRLQVEHPVTELCTEIDIAKAMFRVAAGEKLWFTQDEIGAMGHAIECRIIAEDPYNNFMPSFGVLDDFTPPSGPGVRVDAGFATGVEVSHHYDSLLAKLVTWGSTRDEAVVRMRHALDGFHIVGPQSCIPFHKKMMHDPDFLSGHFTVHTAEKKMADGLLTDRTDDHQRAVALAAALDVLGAKPAASGSGDGAASSGGGASAAASTGGRASTGHENDPWRLSGRPR